MLPWHRLGVVLTPDMIFDLVILVASILFSIAVIKLYNAYGKPRSLLAMLIGVGTFIIGALDDILYATSVLKWPVPHKIDHALIGPTGILLASGSMAYVLRYLLSVAKLDPLTGIYNRRHFKEILDMEIQRSARNNLQFTLLYIDIDDLKLINDRLGHAIGDVVLRRVARKLSDSVRASDVVARWGGDEFVILFPQTNHTGAQVLAERMVAALDNLEVANVQLGSSLGLVAFPDDGENADQLLNLADKRMYQNKREKKLA